MDQSYWSISDILADATKIPCHFKIDVPGVAHLRGDPSVQAQQEQASQSSSISKSGASSRQHYEEEGMVTKGTRVELPYWLAEWLVLQDCVDVSLPKPYSQRVRNALNAGPKSVQLRGQANWWYAMGSRLGGLMDSEMIMELLSSVSSGTMWAHM
jgi:GINS complex subunit 3